MHLDTANVIAIIGPTLAVAFYAGTQTQILKSLKRIVDDHEKRLRDGGL